jgi:hypothetical protein
LMESVNSSDLIVILSQSIKVSIHNSSNSKPEQTSWKNSGVLG